MRYWKASCPYCKAVLASGRGYGDEIPEVWFPFYRCDICGNLIKTEAKEFITQTEKERLSIRASSSNCEYIVQSLDRTNNKDYVKFLKENGFEIYPITQQDILKFKIVDFDALSDVNSTEEATESLYDVGIFIKPEDLDEETGGIKKEKLLQNVDEYNLAVTQNRYGVLAGFAVGFIFCIIFASINPESYLWLLGIVFGLVAHYITAVCIGKVHQNRKKSRNIESLNDLNDQDDEKNSDELTNESANNVDIQTKIRSLKNLYQEGVISEEEYKEKALKIIDGNK